MLAKITNLKEDSADSKELGDDYKGIYFNDDNEQQYFEGGAHFQYKDLCYRLEKIVVTLSPDRKGKSMYQDWEGESMGYC